MAKPVQPTFTNEDFEAPTLKRSVPDELRTAQPSAYVTTKLRKAEIDVLIGKERDRSGMRRAVSEEDIARFERRETRETLPAPPEPPLLPDEVADLDADEKR